MSHSGENEEYQDLQIYDPKRKPIFVNCLSSEIEDSDMKTLHFALGGSIDKDSFSGIISDRIIPKNPDEETRNKEVEIALKRAGKFPRNRASEAIQAAIDRENIDHLGAYRFNVPSNTNHLFGLPQKTVDRFYLSRPRSFDKIVEGYAILSKHLHIEGIEKKRYFSCGRPGFDSRKLNLICASHTKDTFLHETNVNLGFAYPDSATPACVISEKDRIKKVLKIFPEKNHQKIIKRIMRAK